MERRTTKLHQVSKLLGPIACLHQFWLLQRIKDNTFIIDIYTSIAIRGVIYFESMQSPASYILCKNPLN